MERRRDEFAEVGRAVRLAMKRATMANPPLTRGEWKTLAAVIGHVSSYSRLQDSVALSQLAPVANLGDREVGRALGKLARREPDPIVVYRPGHGSRHRILSIVGLPTDDRSTCSPPNTLDEWSNSAPANPEFDRSTSPPPNGSSLEQNGHVDWRTRAPLPEKTSEEKPRARPGFEIDKVVRALENAHAFPAFAGADKPEVALDRSEIVYALDELEKFKVREGSYPRGGSIVAVTAYALKCAMSRQEPRLARERSKIQAQERDLRIANCPNRGQHDDNGFFDPDESNTARPCPICRADKFAEVAP